MGLREGGGLGGRTVPVLGAVLRAVVGFVMVAAIAFLAFVGVGPRTGRYQVLTVLTGSMRPTAPPGSLVVVVPMPLDRVRVGDVITYEIPVDDHRVVTHRVIEVHNPGPHPSIRTQGDANIAPDPWVAALQGDRAYRVRAVIPHVGALVRGMRQGGAHTLSVVIVPVVLAGLWLTMIWWGQPDGDTDVPERPDVVAS